MVRAQIYMTEEQRKAFSARAKLRGKKTSEVIREALDRYLEQTSDEAFQAALQAAAGMWKDRTDLPDFRALRTESDRSFDRE